MSRKGRIIAIEGIDAVGKHTQSLLLQTWFRDHGCRAESLSFPVYGTPIGKEIKAFLKDSQRFGAEVRHMLFAANRWEKLSLIKQLLTENEVVIVNRYTESNLAYGLANGLRLKWLVALEEGIPRSDLVVVLDPRSESLTSRRGGARDSYEKNRGLQLRVQEIYKELAPRFGWIVVDGSKTVESVHRSIVRVVKANLDAGLRAKL